MISLISHRVNIRNAARQYFANFVKMFLFCMLGVVAGIALLVLLCTVLEPEPNSPEGWGIFVALVIVTVVCIFITNFAAKILSSSYCVFTLYRSDLLMITPLSEVAAKNIKGRVRGSLRTAMQTSRVMQEFVERYDFEDLFLNSDFLSCYSHKLVKIMSLRKMGKYTVMRCKTEKFDPFTKKQILRRATFYIDKSEFENADELISVLESRLRNGL